jgi:predicted DNA-binding protein with PD1-like motif
MATQPSPGWANGVSEAVPFANIPFANIQATALRLSPGADLKDSLRQLASTTQLQAGCILSAVGSLDRVGLRFADCNQITQLEGRFEIIAMGGTFSAQGIHLHIGLADSHGQMIGGHLGDGCRIYTTAELVIGCLPHLQFSRQPDPQTGFLELAIAPKSAP